MPPLLGSIGMFSKILPCFTNAKIERKKLPLLSTYIFHQQFYCNFIYLILYSRSMYPPMILLVNN